MKIIKLLSLILLIPLIMFSCESANDYSLTSTVFIEDPYYPGLPIYSEWGYNTFGAYIDREPFVSTDDYLPAKIMVNTDTLHLLLRGEMNSQKVDLTFSIKGYSPATFFDLTELNNVTLDLKENGSAVTLKIGDETTNLNLIEGELIIQKVQRLYVDEEPTRTIISGYFHLKTFLNNEPISISNGRFDLGIGYENFYNY